MAAAKIQVLVKSFLQRRRTEREKSAAILIQARWRGYAARNALRLKRATQLCALRHNAATIIQVDSDDGFLLFKVGILAFNL